MTSNFSCMENIEKRAVLGSMKNVQLAKMIGISMLFEKRFILLEPKSFKIVQYHLSFW